MCALGDRRLVARASRALLLANIRFWPSVAPKIRRQLKRWEARAHLIQDPNIKALALQKLREESFNAEVAATLATLAPRRYRAKVVEAIVAYEVMYDLLDGLTEPPSADPLRTGRELYQAFIDAVTTHDDPASTYGCNDGGYLVELVQVVFGALEALPARPAVLDTMGRAATRCAEAQVRAHAAPFAGIGQLEEWAGEQAAGDPAGWREFLAGAASSVLAVHALIAAAADERTTSIEAEKLDAAYLSICALSTMLDGLVDRDCDLSAGDTAGYLRYYEDHEMLASDLVHAAGRASQDAASLRDGPHHAMTMVGVVAYYLSAPGASTPLAHSVTQRLHHDLQPLIRPTLAVIRTWRLAKRTSTLLTDVIRG